MTLTRRSPMPSTSASTVASSKKPGTKTQDAPSLEEGATALHRVREDVLRVAVAHTEERVRARVDNERHTLGVPGRDRRPHCARRVGQRPHLVLLSGSRIRPWPVTTGFRLLARSR